MLLGYERHFHTDCPRRPALLAKDRKRQAERVLALLEEIRRTPFEGTGKPEPLRLSLPVAGRAESTENIGLSTKWKMQKL